MEAALHNPVHCALLGFSAASTSLPQGYLWVASGGEGAQGGQLEILSLNRFTPRAVKSLQLGRRSLCLQYVPAPVHTEDPDERPPPTSPPGVINTVCVGLDEGDLWKPESRRSVSRGTEPVRTLLVLEHLVWASCGNYVTVIDGASLSTQVRRACVTSLLICQGLLWVGTAQGILITLPVPKLEGIPKITSLDGERIGRGQRKGLSFQIFSSVIENDSALATIPTGPVDFLMATSSTLSPELWKRDSLPDGPDSGSSQESLQHRGTSFFQGGGGEARGMARTGVLL
ncbi:hypothetical protein NHX12_030844 [Muraenolepis orangiensis]|uniref:Rho guanine nucleotide exchange factor 10-like protein n=1 Tax=Muraenolepis orangiensis TaxID=630683 RepID=A0A9Q0IM10_9TELE|nr:hypothetical protein NHX12_030844 [Muraenolepis orangiensis]